MRIDAGDGLTLRFESRSGRIAWHDADWLGPVSLRVGERDALPRGQEPFDGEDGLGDYRGAELVWSDLAAPLRTSVRAYRERPLLVFRCEARGDCAELASGRFERPGIAWPCFRPHQRETPLADDARAFGHQYTEFALPTFAGPSLSDFFLLPQRPALVQPLWVLAGARALLLAPLDAFHEQVIAVPRGRAEEPLGVRCGWHGDLRAPAGFASELALWGGEGVRDTLEAWGSHLRERYGTRRPGRYADAALGRLSYWTDNGAAYWYRSEPGRGVAGTLVAVQEQLGKQGVPVHAFELDSWFYPHEVTRPMDAPEIDVPPTGCLAWEPREDALPGGIDGLRHELGDPPLILHARHFSSRSPYFESAPAWRDGDRAHPEDPAFFDALFAQAEAWGAIQVEQDWLVECFLGVRGLRERPGRARAWQEGLDRAAAEHGLSLHWCMASPADFLQTLTLPRVEAIRSSGDYRYVLGNASLWCWFLYGSALARALGLWPFKDVFLSSPDGEGREGDPHAELEALLAALSAGPVGIGDALGCSCREIVMRTCREDGVLVKPDLPLAPLERCYREHLHLGRTPLLAETRSDHAAGRWTYLLGVHASRSPEPMQVELAWDELDGAATGTPCIAYDWRRGAFEDPAAPGLRYSLAPGEWRLHVLCPVLSSGIALLGDPDRYASAGDRRLRAVRARADGVRCEVLGAPGERVVLAGWSRRPISAARASGAATRDPERLPVDVRAGGGFRLELRLGPRGRSRVEIEAV